MNQQSTTTNRRTTLAALFLTLAMAIGLSGCANKNATTDATSELKVAITSMHTYDPLNLTVGKGDTVRWTNTDTVAHTITSDTTAGPLHSGPIQPGTNFTFAFSDLGTFNYHDDQFGTKGTDGVYTGMVGQIIVEV